MCVCVSLFVSVCGSVCPDLYIPCFHDQFVSLSISEKDFDDIVAENQS